MTHDERFKRFLACDRMISRIRRWRQTLPKPFSREHQALFWMMLHRNEDLMNEQKQLKEGS